MIDIPNERLHVFREAKGDDFASHLVLAKGATIRPIGGADAIDVSKILFLD